MNTKELLFILEPINIPSSSQTVDVINGYVANNPLVKIFLLATFLTSLISQKNGKHILNACSCLKYALLVCIPLLCNIPSTLFNIYSRSFLLCENIFTYTYK